MYITAIFANSLTKNVLYFYNIRSIRWLMRPKMLFKSDYIYRTLKQMTLTLVKTLKNRLTKIPNLFQLQVWCDWCKRNSSLDVLPFLSKPISLLNLSLLLYILTKVNCSALNIHYQLLAAPQCQGNKRFPTSSGILLQMMWREVLFSDLKAAYNHIHWAVS